MSSYDDPHGRRDPYGRWTYDCWGHAAPPPPRDPTKVPPGQMRVSDAERAEVTATLCRHFAEGRLDQAELDERTARVVAAKTRDDLGPLTADLPDLDVPPAAVQAAPPVPALAPWGHHLLRTVAFVMLGLWLLGAASWAFTWGQPFVPWPLLFVVVLLLFRNGGRRRWRSQRRPYGRPLP